MKNIRLFNIWKFSVFEGESGEGVCGGGLEDGFAMPVFLVQREFY